MINCFLFNILCFVAHFVNGSVFTSVSKLEQLAHTEQNMFGALGTYITDAESVGIFVPNDIKTFYKDMSNISAQALQKHFMENPINAYHFIRRLHVTWQDIISTIDCEHCALTVPLQEFQIRVKRIEENSQLDIRVSTQDMQWAALGIVRLWQTYKLHLQSLFRGDILGTRASSLSLDDILFICTQMDQRNDFYKEIVWLQELLKEPTDLEHPLSTKNKTRVTRMLAGAYSKYGMPRKSLDILEKHVSEAESNDHKKLKRDLAFFKTKMNGVSTTEGVILEPRYEDQEKEHYEALCRGHVPRVAVLAYSLH